MKITNLNSTTFSAKQRFLSETGHANMQKLLTKMNSQVVCEAPKGDTFGVNVLDKISIDKDALFIDSRWLLKKDTSKEALNFGDSYIMTRNSKVRINNASGEMTVINKPWYKSSKLISKMAEKYINIGFNNFENGNIVERYSSKVHGIMNSSI